MIIFGGGCKPTHVLPKIQSKCFHTVVVLYIYIYPPFLPIIMNLLDALPPHRGLGKVSGVSMPWHQVCQIQWPFPQLPKGLKIFELGAPGATLDSLHCRNALDFQILASLLRVSFIFGGSDHWHSHKRKSDHSVGILQAACTPTVLYFGVGSRVYPSSTVILSYGPMMCSVLGSTCRNLLAIPTFVVAGVRNWLKLGVAMEHPRMAERDGLYLPALLTRYGKKRQNIVWRLPESWLYVYIYIWK